MLYIHSSEIKCHGNLTSKNCVVDSRFTLKITDFGLPMFMSPQFENDEQIYKGLFNHSYFFFTKAGLFCINNILFSVQLWKAPELQFPIANANLSQLYIGTNKGDVYSFAIIVQEILYRRGVFFLNDEDLKATFNITRRDSNDLSEASTPTKDQPGNKLTYKQIYQTVKTGLRPSLDLETCSKEIIELLKRCWSDSPTERPEFSIINELMRKITK
jgi:atrial natriuretic peptide receptor A